jgi:hypothetical protein
VRFGSSISRLDVWICGLIILLSLLVNLYLGSLIEFPGHGDPCYYLDLARNLHEGRGFVIDYISYFHYFFPEVTHPTGEYWMPLTAMVFRIIYFFTGADFRAIQWCAAVVASLIVGLVYLLGRFKLGLPVFWSGAAALFLAVDLDWLYCVIIPQSGIVFVLIVLPFFLLFDLFCDESFNGRILFIQGLLLGLAHLCRPDGILLWGVMLFFAAMHAWNRRSFAPFFRQVSIIAAGYFLVTGPWFIRNLAVFGRPLPVPSSRFPFLTDYEQIFACSTDFGLRSLLDWGIRAIIQSKCDESIRNLEQLFHFRRLFLVGLLAAIGSLKRFKSMRAGLLYLGILWGVMSFVITLPGSRASHGSFAHALPALLPFLVLGFAAGARTLAELFSRKAAGATSPLSVLKSVAFVGLHAVIGLSFCYSLFAVRELYGYNDAMVVRDIRGLHANLTAIGKILPANAVIMTRNPWEVFYVTRRKSVQIPWDGLTDFLEIARRYKVTHLLLTDRRRPYLEEFISTNQGKSMVELLSESPFEASIFNYSGFRLYRVTLPE